MIDYIAVDRGRITEVPKSSQAVDAWSALMLVLIVAIVVVPWWASW